MVDSRSVLPQELAGGHAGLPCVRRRPEKATDRLPEGIRPTLEYTGDFLPGADAERRPEYTSFSGTRNMSWAMARSRSMGALAQGGILQKALNVRTRTNMDLLVDVLVSAMREDRPMDLRHFRQPYNPNRHAQAGDPAQLTPERRRKKVLQALEKYPLCDLYDLATCQREYWSDISRELGGLPHSVAMKYAMEAVQQEMPPMDRAAFWTAVGTRQGVSEHYRTVNVAGDDSECRRRTTCWRSQAKKSWLMHLEGQ